MSVVAYGITGTSPTTVLAYDISGAGSAGSTRTVLVYDISGGGLTQPYLIATQAAYDPGETVVIAAVNGSEPHTFAFPAGAPVGASVVDNVLTFVAPAKKDASTVTVAYNNLAFLTVNINQAFLTVGDVPATIWVDWPDTGSTFGEGTFGLGPFG